MINFNFISRLIYLDFTCIEFEYHFKQGTDELSRDNKSVVTNQ